jgi:hypothetical protein
MKTATADFHRFDFSFPGLDTLVQVETIDDAVVIRTSRDTFSETRKERFVRELAAEGFIADACRWRPAIRGTPPVVRWLVDRSCFLPSRERTARTRWFMIRVLLSATLLWLVQVGLLWLHPAR